MSNSTVYAEVRKARAAVNNGQTVFAFELMATYPVADLVRGSFIQMFVHSAHLNNLTSLARLALVSDGDLLTLELEGFTVSENFIQYDRLVDFKVNCPPPPIRAC